MWGWARATERLRRGCAPTGLSIAGFCRSSEPGDRPGGWTGKCSNCTELDTVPRGLTSKMLLQLNRFFYRILASRRTKRAVAAGSDPWRKIPAWWERHQFRSSLITYLREVLLLSPFSRRVLRTRYCTRLLPHRRNVTCSSGSSWPWRTSGVAIAAGRRSLLSSDSFTFETLEII